MTATKDDDTEIFKGSRTFMPVAQRFGRGGFMGRGPYEKSGLLDDTGLPAGDPVKERYEFPVPGAGAQGDRPVPVKVTAKLWYLPFGKRDSTAVLWREESRTLEVALPPGETQTVSVGP